MERPANYSELTTSLKDMTELQVKLPLFKGFRSEDCARNSTISLKDLAKKQPSYLNEDLEREYIKDYSIEFELSSDFKKRLTKNQITDTDLVETEKYLNDLYSQPGKYRDKFADLPIFDPETGELRKVMVELYNRRTFNIVKNFLGIELTEKDPYTGLYINPMMVQDPHREFVYGRGWAKIGANLTVDIRLEIEGTNPPEVLVIERPIAKDIGESAAKGLTAYALPGGLIDFKTFSETETAFEAMERETLEETKVKLPESVREKLKKSTPKSFISADSRNSVFTFNVDTLFNVKVSKDEADEIRKQLELTPETKIKPEFMPITEVTGNEIANFGAHKVLIKGNV